METVMLKYNGLLSKASREFSIHKGIQESEIRWKSRIIYTIIGRMALASLFDKQEEDTVSIVRFKSRIKRLLNSYRDMYPEVKSFLTNDAEALAGEIYEIYLRNGIIYHEPNRIVMSTRNNAAGREITFTRGYPLEECQRVSGLGTYLFDEKAISDIESFFALECASLDETWQYWVNNAKWHHLEEDRGVEYLRTTPPFTRGYWVDRPNKDGMVALLRFGMVGAKLYYLYKKYEGNIMVSQLPNWRVESHNYRMLSNACLAYNGQLPETKYSFDGEIVNISFQYLPPPNELFLWKLYSWPATIMDLPRDFNRVCNRIVFEEIKVLMEQRGYAFIEE